MWLLDVIAGYFAGIALGIAAGMLPRLRDNLFSRCVAMQVFAFIGCLVAALLGS